MQNNVRYENIWLVGAGPMAEAHADVLKAQGRKFTVIGRGEKRAAAFEASKGVPVLRGGIDDVLSETDFCPEYVIVATNVESLKDNLISLINRGVKNILAEKPAGLNLSQIEEVNDAAEKAGVCVYVAYNRRFFASVIKAREIINEDGGVKSFNFEFTEWAHVIEKLDKTPESLKNWLLANSSHVIDLAFYLGGTPVEMSTFTGSDDGWYGHSAVYSGAGRTDCGALFSYQANWRGPGRWSVEMITSKHRLIFRPIEKLQIQEIGSVKTEFVEIDDSLDSLYKPGLYLQARAFFEKDNSDMISLQEHVTHARLYEKISNP